LKSAYLTCRQDRIKLDDLEIPEDNGSVHLKDRLADCAVSIIKERLQINKSNVKATARDLGISPRTIYRYLKK